MVENLARDVELLTAVMHVVAEKLAELRAKTDRQLADYVRVKLNLALQLACEAEQERRAGRWESAEKFQRQWEGVMAEVQRLLPLVRTGSVPLLHGEPGKSG